MYIQCIQCWRIVRRHSRGIVNGSPWGCHHHGEHTWDDMISPGQQSQTVLFFFFRFPDISRCLWFPSEWGWCSLMGICFSCVGTTSKTYLTYLHRKVTPCRLSICFHPSNGHVVLAASQRACSLIWGCVDVQWSKFNSWKLKNGLELVLTNIWPFEWNKWMAVRWNWGFRRLRKKERQWKGYRGVHII